MCQEGIWGAEAAASYDTPGTGMFSPDVLGLTVDRLAELAGNGRVLEFASDAREMRDQALVIRAVN